MVAELGYMRVWVDCRQGSWTLNTGRALLVIRLTSSISLPSGFHLYTSDDRELSLLSQPTAYAHLWRPHSGGPALWIHRFWIFAIASYLVFLLPLSLLYNLFSTKRSSKNPSQPSQNPRSSSVREKSKTLRDWQGLRSSNPSPTWQPAPLKSANVFETYHLAGCFTLGILLLSIFFYSVCLLSWTQYSWDYEHHSAGHGVPCSVLGTSFNSAHAWIILLMTYQEFEERKITLRFLIYTLFVAITIFHFSLSLVLPLSVSLSVSLSLSHTHIFSPL